MHPTSKELYKIYATLHKKEQIQLLYGERNLENLDSIVKTVESRFFDVERFSTNEEKAIAYLYLIVKNHPMPDGNKRLAVYWFQVFCEANGLVFDARYPLDAYAIAIEASDVEMNTLLVFLEVLLFVKK